MYITLFPAWAAGVASRNPLARHLLIGVIICSDEWNEQKRYSTTNRKWGIKRVYIPSPSKSPFVLMTCIKTAACLIMTSSAVRAGFDFRAHIQYAREQYSMRNANALKEAGRGSAYSFYLQIYISRMLTVSLCRMNTWNTWIYTYNCDLLWSFRLKHFEWWLNYMYFSKTRFLQDGERTNHVTFTRLVEGFCRNNYLASLTQLKVFHIVL